MAVRIREAIQLSMLSLPQAMHRRGVVPAPVPALAVTHTQKLNAYVDTITAAAHQWCSQWCFAVGDVQPGPLASLDWAVIPAHNPVGLGIMRACTRFASELAIENSQRIDFVLQVALVRVVGRKARATRAAAPFNFETTGR